MKKCSKCKKEIFAPNAQICPYCGSRDFAENDNCTACGHGLTEGQNYCPYCGTRTKRAVARSNSDERVIKESINVSIKKWQDYTDDNIFKDYIVRRNDSFSYCITDTKPNDLRIIKRYSVKPNTIYVVSADIKTENIVNEENKIDPKGASIRIGNDNTSRNIL